MRKFTGQKIAMDEDFNNPLDLSTLTVDLPIPSPSRASKSNLTTYRRLSIMSITNSKSLQTPIRPVSYQSEWVPPSFPDHKTLDPQKRASSYEPYSHKRNQSRQSESSSIIVPPTYKQLPTFQKRSKSEIPKPIPVGPSFAENPAPDSTKKLQPPVALSNHKRIYSAPSDTQSSKLSLASSLIESYMHMNSDDEDDNDGGSSDYQTVFESPQASVDSENRSLFSFESGAISSKESVSSSEELNTPVALPTKKVSKPLPDLPIETLNQFEARNYNSTKSKIMIIDHSTPPKLPKHHNNSEKNQFTKSQSVSKNKFQIPKDTSVFTRTPTYTKAKKLYGNMPILESRKNAKEEQQRSASLQYLQENGIEPFMLSGYQETNKLKVIN